KSPLSTPAVVSMPPAESEVVEVAPVETIRPVTPSRPIVQAERAPVVPTAMRPRQAAPVLVKTAVMTAPSSIAVAPSPAVPRPVDEPDAIGQSLGGLLIGLVGAGGAIAWPRVAGRVRRRGCR